MLPTYQAILSGNRLEWVGDAPSPAAGGVRVHVTLLDSPAAGPPGQGARMAGALELIAGRGGVAGIADPAAWEREQRADRALPGRAE